MSHWEQEGGTVDEDCTTTKIATAIFTQQFLTFLTAVHIAITNDVYLRAKVTLAFSDLQQYFQDKGLSTGQIVSILSTFIAHSMEEKKLENIQNVNKSSL